MIIYNLKLSNGDKYILDQEDYQKVIASIGTANFIKIKQCIFNPSYVLSITPKEVDEKKEIDGYFDEERRVFVQTGMKPVNLVKDTWNETNTPQIES